MPASRQYVVHKIAILPAEHNTVLVPERFQLLHCDYQHGKIAFWYRCEKDHALDERVIRLVGTGADAPDPAEGEHIGTVLLHNGSLVLHAFIMRRGYKY